MANYNPQAVRNFWIETEVDGKQERLASGPKAKDGGFETTVYVRDHGQVTNALTMRGEANPDGTLTVRIYAEGVVVSEYTYTR